MPSSGQLFCISYQPDGNGLPVRGKERSVDYSSLSSYGISFRREPILAMLRDFHLLTGIRVAYYTPDRLHGVWVPVEINAFCELLRTNPTMNERCQSCDRDAFAKACETREPVLYHCHTGISEAVAPLFEGERLLGFLMMGQTLERTPSLHDWQITLSRLGTVDLDTEKLRTAFHQLPSLPAEKVAAAFRLLGRQARLIISSEWVQPHAMPVLERLDAHIRANLHGDLQPAALARMLGLSSSRLSHVVKEQTGRTVTYRVHSMRLFEAAVLLRSTNLTVSEVAERTGWSDPRYFSRIFHRQYTLSPQQYRKKCHEVPMDTE